MARDRLVARAYEIHRLERCEAERDAQLVILYGRRRVGKTYLITEFFNRRFDFRFTGSYKENMQTQLQHFASELSGHLRKEIDPPKDWTEAFLMLRNYIDDLPRTEKCVIFFDEMPWMDTLHSNFLPAFEYFWNSYGSSVENLIFIVCGSASAWMTKNIAKNKGGLFQRQTCSLYLRPFTIRETEEYLQRRNIHWSRYDIAECYMALGGIPYYLSLLIPEMTMAENIDNLFFRKRSELWDEYSQLYRTLFSNSEQYIRIVEALSEKRKGMTREEIACKTGLARNGKLTEMLENLENSDFIRSEKKYGGKKSDMLYQLKDYYTWFYIRFIKDQPGRDEHFWRNTYQNPSRQAWKGLTFELVCKDHIPQIKQKLGISGVMSDAFSWQFAGNETHSGAQIDMVIARGDRVINLCEIKYCNGAFEIDKETDRNLRNKMETFQAMTKTKMTLQITMITTFGIKQNMYSSLVNTQVTLDDLFAEA